MKLEAPPEFNEFILSLLQWLVDQVDDCWDWSAGEPGDKRAFEWFRSWVEGQEHG